jgi:hypothetical protein
MRLGNSSVRAAPTDSIIFLPRVAMNWPGWWLRLEFRLREQVVYNAAGH